MGDLAPKAFRRPEFTSDEARPMTTELKRVSPTELAPPLGLRVGFSVMVMGVMGMAELKVNWRRMRMRVGSARRLIVTE